jgi:hypothetical protein
MHTFVRAALVSIALVAASALPASAGDATSDNPNPYTLPNESWISISGTVKDVSADSFLLSFGKGVVKVEMDDGDRDADGYKLVAGDKVTVNGKIDDDFFEQTKIEAMNVYVEKLGTYFWASAEDEEDGRYLYTTLTPVLIDSYTVVSGTVSEINPSEHEFTLDTGPRMLTVEVDEMAYDPLDDDGYQKIRPGDVVRASGQMDDHDLFEGRELEAESIITLSKG